VATTPKQLQNLRVSAHHASSVVSALVVHTVDESGAYVSPGAGSTQVSVKEIQTSSGASVMDSTNASIGVTIRAGSAAGTEYTDGDVDATVSGGAILFDNSSNTLRPVTLSRGLPVNVVAGSAASTEVTIRQSTYTDLQTLSRVADRDQSTQVAGVTNTTPASTAYALVVREAGSINFATDSISIVGAVASNLATVYQSTVGALRAAVYQSTAADLNVTVSGYSTTVNVSSVSGAVNMRSSAANALVTVYQSTFTDLNCRVNAPSTANSSNYLPVRITDGSSYITPGLEYTDGSTASSLAGPSLLYNNSSNNTMRMVGTAQPLPAQIRTSSGADMSDSTETALRVNVVAGAAGGSTLITVRQSTVGDLRAAVYQSTAADLNVTVAGYSTTVNVSSVAGAVIVRSSAADMAVTASQNSTAWSVLARVTTSSGGGVEGSTTAPAVGVVGLHVRQVNPTLLSTTVLITSTHSTAIYPIVSSAASPLRHKVYAYFVGSTHTNPSTLIFCSSASAAGFDHWHVNFGSGSSGITAANLALDPPGFLFGGVANTALNVKIEGGSSATATVVARVSISYFTEA
jgi:hypothetical protein